MWTSDEGYRHRHCGHKHRQKEMGGGKSESASNASPPDQSREDGENDGHRHGNFKHYYEYHTASQERFKGIVPGSFRRIWQELQEPDLFSILDIGCNEGNLTAELLSLVQSELPSSVRCIAYGLDFDNVLIDVARERHADIQQLHFFTVNVMDGDSLEHFLVEHKVGDVSVVACLRTTMWVHLNLGDAGLTRLLLLLGTTASRSALLLDPQKYSYYKKACTRNAKLGRPCFPYSLEDLRLSNKELPSYCLDYFRDNFNLSVFLHKDIEKWGGTLLFLMKENDKTPGIDRKADETRDIEINDNNI